MKLTKEIEERVQQEKKIDKVIVGLRRYCQIVKNGAEGEILRQISSAIIDNTNNWCGNFAPEIESFISIVGYAIANADCIDIGNAYYYGDFLMTKIMASEDIDDAEMCIFDIIKKGDLHKGVCIHIVNLINGSLDTSGEQGVFDFRIADKA